MKKKTKKTIIRKVQSQNDMKKRQRLFRVKTKTPKKTCDQPEQPFSASKSFLADEDKYHFILYINIHIFINKAYCTLSETLVEQEIVLTEQVGSLVLNELKTIIDRCKIKEIQET